MADEKGEKAAENLFRTDHKSLTHAVQPVCLPASDGQKYRSCASRQALERGSHSSFVPRKESHHDLLCSTCSSSFRSSFSCRCSSRSRSAFRQDLLRQLLRCQCAWRHLRLRKLESRQHLPIPDRLQCAAQGRMVYLPSERLPYPPLQRHWRPRIHLEQPSHALRQSLVRTSATQRHTEQHSH